MHTDQEGIDGTGVTCNPSMTPTVEVHHVEASEDASQGDGIPMQELPALKAVGTTIEVPIQDIRAEALEFIFGFGPSDLARWPGILAACEHLETCFEVLMGDDYNILWTTLGRPVPTTTRDCWHWCLAVLRAFESLGRDEESGRQASLERAYQGLLAQNQNSTPHTALETGDKNTVIWAMFTVLCRTTMGLTPLHHGRGTTLLSVREWSASVYASNVVRRPADKMFRHFRHASFRAAPLPRLHDEESQVMTGPAAEGAVRPLGAGGEEDAIHVSCLNYASLCTFGRVRLDWVDVLSSHLAFDRRTRTLSVFRFPSYCVGSIVGRRRLKVHESIISELLPYSYYSDSSMDPSSVHREVLLSYRLLFGQNKKSRSLAAGILNKSTPGAGPPPDTARDMFLVDLCTLPGQQTSVLRPWRSVKRWSRGWREGEQYPSMPGEIFPYSTQHPDGGLLESDTYSAREDFPVFGPRLLALQRYSMRQQPGRLADLWRDRRSPLQWYTLWAVLLVGVFAVILGVLQLIVTIAQLVFGILETT